MGGGGRGGGRRLPGGRQHHARVQHRGGAHAVEALQLGGGDPGAAGDDPPAVVGLDGVGAGRGGGGGLTGEADGVARVDDRLVVQPVQAEEVHQGHPVGRRDGGEGVARTDGVDRRLLGLCLRGQAGEQEQWHGTAGEGVAQAAGRGVGHGGPRHRRRGRDCGEGTGGARGPPGAVRRRRRPAVEPHRCYPTVISVTIPRLKPLSAAESCGSPASSSHRERAVQQVEGRRG